MDVEEESGEFMRKKAELSCEGRLSRATQPLSANEAPHPPVTTDWKCGNGWLRVEVYVVLWQNG